MVVLMMYVSLIIVNGLSAERPIDVQTLSYRTKPKVTERVATVEARVSGETRIHRFPCPWSSLHVFEVTCAEDSECLLDVWSSQNTTYGQRSLFRHS